MQFIQRLGLQGLLSFPPDTEPFELHDLNVLIGPNASGKSNVIEALELIRATPTDFAAAIRDGGGAMEWLWKGEHPPKSAIMDIETEECAPSTGRPLRYRLEFTSANGRAEVLDEVIEETRPIPGHNDQRYYYRFQRGQPVINVMDRHHDYNSQSLPDGGRVPRILQRCELLSGQSVLAQRKDPDIYPEVTWIGRRFEKIQIFRDRNFGGLASLRLPQPANLPEDRLLPDCRNLALLVNGIERHNPQRLNELLKRFMPRFDRISTKVSGGTAQFQLHESGFASPIPSARLSNGTLRFIAMLVTLLAPSPPPLVCIEEPELGLHPDALAVIGELLLEASKRMQLVVTTHSEALVSAFSERPSVVVTCERVGSGTMLERIDPDQLIHWLHEYTLGDIWCMGVLGGNP